jgi:predicted ATP-grasp superfamily ATP-dependent carboligase
VSGYGIIRSLGRRDVPVYAITDLSADFGRFSRYCKGTFPYPPHAPSSNVLFPDAPDENLMVSRLIEWSARIPGRAVLYSTSDWFCILLANQQAALSPHFDFHWVPVDTLHMLTDKALMSAFCEQIGILSPPTKVIENQADLAHALDDFSGPCIVKPVRSYNLNFPIPKKVFLASSQKELAEFFQQFPHLIGQVILQEVIEGGDDNIVQCTTLIRRSGQPEGTATVRKLRQSPPGYGSMCYGRSEPIEAVIEPTMKLLRALDYRGLASVEFKQSPRGGKYYFIEMNPRLPWYNGLFADTGVNLPYLAYLDLAEPVQGAGDEHPQQNQIYWSSLPEQLRWYRESKNGLGRHSLFKLVASIARSRSHSWWNLFDPVPFMVAFSRMILAQARKVLRWRADKSQLLYCL